MEAVILAAGAGTRLRPVTETVPKCLVPIDDRTLLDHQIDALAGAGVERVHLVVGYLKERVLAHCGDGTRHGLSIDYVENARWAETNSIYSLHLARDAWSADDVFLCNCDILFDSRLAVRLAAHPGSGIAVDDQRPRLAGEMNVRFDETRRVRAISKQLDPARTQAVSAQIALLRDGDGAAVGAEVERIVAEDLQSFPTAAYGPLVSQGRMVAVDVADIPWAEIDSVEEYEAARRECAPRLGSDG